jgi:hypothetical protein
VKSCCLVFFRGWLKGEEQLTGVPERLVIKSSYLVFGVGLMVGTASWCSCRVGFVIEERLPGVPERLVKVKTKEQLPGVPDGLYEGEEQLPGVPDGLYEGDD